MIKKSIINAGGDTPPEVLLRNRKGLIIFVLLFLLTSSFINSLHGDEVTRLSNELIQLRSEIERIQADIESEQNDMRNQLRSFSQQKAEVEASISRENLRIKQLQLALEKKVSSSGKQGIDEKELSSIILSSIEEVKKSIKSGLPFKVKERTDSLEQLGEQLQNGAVRPERAASRLWSIIEDEFRLTRENGIFREIVMLDGEERLTEVVRLGMVMMFFKTADDRTGFVRKSGDIWEYRVIEERKGKEQIENLFDSMKKQIRAGYFELPNALPPMEVKE
jgi:hypothetical protein